MYNPYGGGPGLNRFLLVSVVLHALLFVALPNLDSMFEPDMPSMAGGGVVQIMHIESSAVARLSPVVDPSSHSTTPRVTEPRPQAEVQEQRTAAEQATASAQEPEVAHVSVERGQPVTPEQPLVPEPTVREEPGVGGEGEFLTSPDGPEVVVEMEDYEDDTPPEDEQDPGGISGSGTGTAGEEDQAGMSESGEGEAESAPPIPAPPASGSSIYPGGGGPVFPKHAQHGRIEGSVKVLVSISTEGKMLGYYKLASSGDEQLDQYVFDFFENDFVPIPLERDYSMEMTISFRDFTPSTEYGEIRWLDSP